MNELLADPVEVDPGPPFTTAQAAGPLARVRGQPWLELPRDLYIPPEALEVILESFEGPLDLLLWLIRHNGIDVLDIPMAELTAQYMEYVDAMRSRNLELAAEYLVMAALLIEIKSRMLLPRPLRAEESEEHDPRAELVRRLLAYEQIKQAARNLDCMPQLGRNFQAVSVWPGWASPRRLPRVACVDLLAAWGTILRRARMQRHLRVGRQELSVREHMGRILRMLKERPWLGFAELFRAEAGRAELVVTFLALLELVRERFVDLIQNEPFAPIHARLADARTEPYPS